MPIPKYNLKKLTTMVLLSCVLLSLLGWIGAEKAYACSCVVPGSYTEELEKNSHVLDATVMNKTEIEQGNLDIELSVSAVWKGEAERETHVITANNSAACGYEFHIGTRYAVFAQQFDGELHVSLCGVTTPIIDDSAIFTELGQPTKLPEDPTVEPTSRGDSGEKDNRASEDTAVPTSASAEGSSALSPEQIKSTVTETELEEKIDNQHSRVLMLFVSIGFVLLIGAALLLINRKKR